MAQACRWGRQAYSHVHQPGGERLGIFSDPSLTSKLDPDSVQHQGCPADIHATHPFLVTALPLPQVSSGRYQRHFMDGDGCVLSLAFPGGGRMPRFRNRYVRTSGFVAEQVRHSSSCDRPRATNQALPRMGIVLTPPDPPARSPTSLSSGLV